MTIRMRRVGCKTPGVVVMMKPPFFLLPCVCAYTHTGGRCQVFETHIHRDGPRKPPHRMQADDDEREGQEGVDPVGLGRSPAAGGLEHGLQVHHRGRAGWVLSADYLMKTRSRSSVGRCCSARSAERRAASLACGVSAAVVRQGGPWMDDLCTCGGWVRGVLDECVDTRRPSEQRRIW